MDASEAMLEIAKAQYPHMTFLQGDACSFHLKEPLDAIFSNAVFHWIDASMHPHMLCHLAGQLKTGGELVCEFGGNGCAETVSYTHLVKEAMDRLDKYVFNAK